MPARGMIIGDHPSPTDDELGRPLSPSTPAGAYLDEVLREADLDRSDLYVTLAVKCRPPAGSSRAGAVETAQRACGPAYLDAEIAAVRPAAVLSMGAPGYWHFVRMSGVFKNRGRAFYDPSRDVIVVPTVSPTAVLANPALHDAFVSDVRKFRRLMLGVDTSPRVNVIEVRTAGDFVAMLSALEAQGDRVLTFDLETRGLNDHPAGATPHVWCAALTRGSRTDGAIDVWLVPLEHPDSPFLEEPETLRAVVLGLCDLLERARTSGHNVKFDARWLATLRRRYMTWDKDRLRAECEALRTRSLWPLAERRPRGRRPLTLERPVRGTVVQVSLGERGGE